jgi:hypothetical protein
MRHFKRPYNSVFTGIFSFLGAILSFLISFFSLIAINIACILISHNKTLLFSSNIVLLISGTITVIVFSCLVIKLGLYNLTEIFCLSKKMNGHYEINMRALNFIKLAHKFNSTYILFKLITDFPKAIELSSKRFPEEKVTFQTNTWLVNMLSVKFSKRYADYIYKYKKAGFIFEGNPKRRNILKNISLIFLAYIAYGIRFNPKDLTEAKFQVITWKNENADYLISHN